MGFGKLSKGSGRLFLSLRKKPDFLESPMSGTERGLGIVSDMRPV